MRIALAAAKFPKTIEEAVEKVKYFICKAREQKGDIICFPETYIPGMRGQNVFIPEYDHEVEKKAVNEIAECAMVNNVAVILPTECQIKGKLYNGAFVISEKGEILGYQTKNQLPIEEEQFYVAGSTRRIFELKGVKVGIAICHEGWRYPETVRWAAARGAQIVFHPNYAGSDISGNKIREWGKIDSPYYEKAMICRSVENTIYFASINYAMEYQDAATSLISPEGECLAYVPYGQEQLLIQEIDLEKASQFYAKRYNEDLYIEE